MVASEGLYAHSSTLCQQRCMTALLRSRHAPSDNMLHIPVGYHVHAAKVLKCYAPDMNQAIQCMISYQTLCKMKT
jgi:hypothetical protein